MTRLFAGCLGRAGAGDDGASDRLAERRRALPGVSLNRRSCGGCAPIGEFVEGLRRQNPQLRHAEMVPGIHSGGYGENDWRGSGRFAADYGRAMEESPLPDIGKRFDLFAPQIADKVLELDPRKAAQYGLGTSEDIELLRRTIAEKGWDGFMRLIKSGRISNAIVPLVLGWAGLGQVEEDH